MLGSQVCLNCFLEGDDDFVYYRPCIYKAIIVKATKIILEAGNICAKAQEMRFVI